MTDLIKRLREGVPTRVERWPGNDGEDIIHDTGAATAIMREAADEIERAIIVGRIEAFEFAARQFRVYADDNDTLHARYGTKSKIELARAEKRSQTFRDAADDLDNHAANQKIDLAALGEPKPEQPNRYERAIARAETTFRKNKSRMHVLRILRGYLNEERGGSTE